MVSSALSFVLLASFGTLVHGYGSGAPNSEQICQDLTPKHGVDPQTSASPYTLTLDKTETKPNGEVKITISGNNVTFKGFIVQGRKVGAQGPATPVGKFVDVKNNGESQPMNCNKILGSSITHTNNKEKKEITLTWIAPDYKGTYQLLVTIVQSGYVYFVAQPSQDITVA